MTTDADAAIKYAATPDGLEEFGLIDPYAEWLKAEGVKVITDYAFDDIAAIELGPWERKGGKGAVINIPYHVLTNDTQIVEINPGSKSEPEHHLYEEYVYIVSGRGATSIWLDGGEKKTFEWTKGSLFSIPLNCWYEHFNGSGVEPARYLAVTSAPPNMRLFSDNDFDPYASSTATIRSPLATVGQMTSSAATASCSSAASGRRTSCRTLLTWRSTSGANGGAGGINSMFEMASNVSKAHISEFPVGTYKKAHRHGPGANLVLLSGDAGFSLLWTKEDMSDIRKADWKVGSLVIVPNDGTYHQHFNSGTRRARYMALTPGTHGLRAQFPRGQGADQSFKEGGYQIEYEDEDPKIHEIFEGELEKNGVTCRMKAFISYCNGVVGPTSAKEA